MRCVQRRVTRVIDGDTFVINSPIRGSRFIRIAGIDAPEKWEFGYARAKRQLENEILNQFVNVCPVGRSYDRIVAKVKKKSRSW
jgi:endonuclease YncB( thermonuclease family)